MNEIIVIETDEQADIELAEGIRLLAVGAEATLAGVVKIGNALKFGKGNKSNQDFNKWVRASGLEEIKPYNDNRERSEAMRVAELFAVFGNLPNTPFDGCRNSRPSHIMQYVRPRLPGAKPKPEIAAPIKPTPTPQTDKAHEAYVEAVESGEPIPNVKEFAKQVGVSRETMSKGIDRARQEQQRLKAEQDEKEFEAAVAEFTPKKKVSLDEAVRRYKEKLDKSFEEAVREEVRRRIVAADDSTRKHNKELSQENLTLRNRLYLTEKQFRELQMCVHPDMSASQELRNKVMDFLVTNKNRLVKLEAAVPAPIGPMPGDDKFWGRDQHTTH